MYLVDSIIKNNLKLDELDWELKKKLIFERKSNEVHFCFKLKIKFFIQMV
jgi:hypothetical protein